MMFRRALVVAGLVVSLGLVAFEVSKKERTLATGRTVLLELAPVDPRSLIQGDYMRLEYAIARSAPTTAAWPRRGALIVAADEHGVARFVRVDRGEPLAAGQQRLAYRLRHGRLHVGTDAYYFQEGTADRYEAARYGELRVDADGTALLVGLRDAAQQVLR